MKDPTKKRKRESNASAHDVILQSIDDMTLLDNYWKEQVAKIYELKLSLTDPKFTNMNHLRQAFRFYIIPALETVLNEEEKKQERFVRHLRFLFDPEKTRQFLKHFYGVVKTEKGDWEFLKRDEYDQDRQVLYDLHKVKKTITGVQMLLKDLDQRRSIFPSAFSKEKQLENLKGMNSALFMAFKLSLKPAHQVEIFKNINLEYVSDEMVEKRRAQCLTYAKPVVLETNPYRRTFLHILFRHSIKTKIKEKETVIRYNLVDFHEILREYFDFFLRESGEDAEALRVYHNLHINGKPLAENIIDDPDPDNLIFEEIEEIKSLV